MKSRLRWFLWVVVSLAAASLLIYALWPQPIAVEWLEAERGPMQVTVDEDGKTRVKERYVVAAPLAGQLSRIELREGDAVIASQTELATIEPADPALLDARSIAEAEARVRVTQAAMEQATARLAAADELHKLATRHWERAVPLAKSSAIPAEELDEKEHQKAITGENLRAARFAKQVAEFEVQQAEAALLRSKPATSPEQGTQRFVIRSPVDFAVLATCRSRRQLPNVASHSRRTRPPLLSIRRRRRYCSRTCQQAWAHSSSAHSAAPKATHRDAPPPSNGCRS